MVLILQRVVVLVLQPMVAFRSSADGETTSPRVAFLGPANDYNGTYSSAGCGVSSSADGGISLSANGYKLWTDLRRLLHQ